MNEDVWSMSAIESIAVLRGHIAHTRTILADLDEYYRGFRTRELPELGRGRTAAIVVAEVLDDTYTALETLVLRVSQFFENRLASDRWHSDLLEKMTLEIPRHSPAAGRPTNVPALGRTHEISSLQAPLRGANGTTWSSSTTGTASTSWRKPTAR